jgi:hypothetical protein
MKKSWVYIALFLAAICTSAISCSDKKAEPQKTVTTPPAENVPPEPPGPGGGKMK